MQTFLPYSDFRRSAAALDQRRLGKQRVETLQILRALTFSDYGWRTHPAVTMWTGHTAALVVYGAAVTRRWQAAGFGDTVLPQLLEFLGTEPLRTQQELAAEGRLPPWLGNRRLHRSHQAALLRKDAAHYRRLFPSVDPDLPYVWPESQPPAAHTGPVSAWVVRMDAPALDALHVHGRVGLRAGAGEGAAQPEGAGNRNTKRRRQLRAFSDEMAPGDPVVVPVGQRLLLASVTGEYQWSTRAPDGLHHQRPVRFSGEIERADLRHPVFLQDPRLVFALRDEPQLEG